MNVDSRTIALLRRIQLYQKTYISWALPAQKCISRLDAFTAPSPLQMVISTKKLIVDIGGTLRHSPCCGDATTNTEQASNEQIRAGVLTRWRAGLAINGQVPAIRQRAPMAKSQR